MSKLKITGWYGGLGNNVLQVCRALYLAEKTCVNIVEIPDHPVLQAANIAVTMKKSGIGADLEGYFFDLKGYDVDAPPLTTLKEIASRYKEKFLSPEAFDMLRSMRSTKSPNTVVMHVRAGDIFSWKPHPAYVPPPLDYYLSCVVDEKEVLLVAEGRKNPVVRHLKQQPNVLDYSTGVLLEDFSILCSANILIGGFGTFALAAFLLSDSIEKLIMPSYMFATLKEHAMQGDSRVHSVQVPDYIEVGEWKNTRQQRMKMVTYKMPVNVHSS